MLEHQETVDGRLASIDNHLAVIAEAAKKISKNGLVILAEEQLQQLALYFAEALHKQEPVPAQIDELEPLLDKMQVMEYLDIKETAYYNWIKNKKLKPRGSKGQHKYYLNDIKALMEQRTYRKRG